MTDLAPTLEWLVPLASGVLAVLAATAAEEDGFFGIFSRDTPDTPTIREAIRGDGPTEFSGQIRPVTDAALFDAPFSGETAVLATYEVEERRPTWSSQQTPKWVSAGRGAIRRPFIVEDLTGRVKIDPASATIEAGDEPRQEAIDTGGILPEPARLRLSKVTDAVDDLDLLLAQGERDYPRRYYEGCVVPGETVHVTGCRPSGELPGRSDVDAVLTPSDGEEVRITAPNRSVAPSTTANLRAIVAYLVGGFLVAGLLLVTAVLVG